MTNKGTIYNKEKFLDRLAKNLNRSRTDHVTKPEWSYSPQTRVLHEKTKDELIDVFMKQCETIHTKVIKTTFIRLSETLETMITDQHMRRIITSNEAAFAEYQLSMLLNEQLPEKGYDVHVWKPEMGRENIAIAEKADVGIAFSDITLAESGTVVLFSNKNKGRAISLLPTAFIAIIPKSTIVPRMTQATSEIHRRVKKGEVTPSCINFISGPSNSADIEMNLVVGVHGPVQATYILVTDK